LEKKGAFYRSPAPTKYDRYNHLDWINTARPAKAGQKSGLKQRGNHSRRSDYFWPWAG
jgi:hypothetical protein